jgi:hypothetical protein
MPWFDIYAFAHLFPSIPGLSHWVYRARFWCSNSNASTPIDILSTYDSDVSTSPNFEALMQLSNTLPFTWSSYSYYILKMYWFNIYAFAHLFPSTTGLSHWVYRARFWCSNYNAFCSYKHDGCSQKSAACILLRGSQYHDTIETFIKGNIQKYVSKNRCALYSFSFDQGYFYPIGFLLLGKVLTRQPW